MAKHYDIVIIGGGIHGAGVAQAAAVQGYSVLLLEKTGIASGTSGRSSKLIHGGLRYLETGQFSLVYECLRERAFLLNMAPELVRRISFHIPFYRHSTHQPWQIQTGLSLYALLGGLGKNVRFHILPRAQWQELDGLETEGLQRVFQYHDAQTDDAGLTRAIMQSAIDFGMEIALPGTFIAAELGSDKNTVQFKIDDQIFTCTANVIINAAGPWVNKILQNISPPIHPIPISLVQGAHIVFEGSLTRGIYYVESPRDYRAVFVMPWQDKIMVGTTETVFEGDLDDVEPLLLEKEYLLETMFHYFPTTHGMTPDSIEHSFAGLRVLPLGKGKLSRRHREIIYHTDRKHKPRVLSIYGGKLTSYRSTAVKVMHRISGSLGSPKRRVNTESLPLNPVDVIG